MICRLPASLARALLLLLGLGALAPAYGQVMVELPFDAGDPARVMVSKSWSHDVVATSARVVRPPFVRPAAEKPKPADEKNIVVSAVPSTAPLPDLLSAIAGPENTLIPKLSSFTSGPFSPTPETRLISSFNGDAASGATIAGSSWVGQVTQNAGYITIGGTARNDNGWGADHVSLNATGMNFITITAQRDAGNATGSLFLQFEDVHFRTQVFSLSTSSFAIGTPTQAQIVLGVWSGSFDFTQIVGWSIGGGNVGNNDFRMSLHNVEFAASAIPEPSTYAAFFGVAALATAAVRRRRRRD